MNFTFENHGANTYLVYSVKPEDTIDTLSLGMLTNNKILGLAQTQFSQMDANKFIMYNVSAHVSVKQFFAGAVNRKRLLGVFKGIVNALLSAEDYMIDTRSIVIDLDYMFADVSTCDTVLICLPIVEIEQNQVELGSFFKSIMFSTQFDQTDSCEYVAKIINYLNSVALFSLEDFKAVLEGIEGEETPKSAVQQKQPVVTRPIVKEQDVPQQAVQSQSGLQEKTCSVQGQAAQAMQASPAQSHSAVGTKPDISAAAKIAVPPAPQKMAVLGQNSPSSNIPDTSTSDKTGQEISWFYLMQHYNKENAAAYKAQKEAKKRTAAANKGKTPAQQAPAAKKPQPASQPANNFGFAVPGQATPEPAAQPAPQPITQPTVSASVQQPAYVPRQVPQGQTANFGETTVLGGGVAGETTVLTAAQNPVQMIVPHLIRKKTNEKISLSKPVFRVGKEKSYVDYFIGDNTAISRSHADFITRDGECFVVDVNSTNHTFVNGTMIQSNVETPIKHGDTVRLANEDFEFKLY